MNESRGRFNYVWRYFDRCGDDAYATCKLCHRTYSFKSTTHNLKHHLRKRHGLDETETVQRDSRSSSPAGSLEYAVPENRLNKSALWNFFKRIKTEGAEKKAECNFCGKIYSYKTTASNLRSHLMNMHKDIQVQMDTMFTDEEDNEPLLKSEDDNSVHETPIMDSVANDIARYFERETGGRARCVVCRATMAHKIGTMKDHLRGKHPKLLLEIYQNTDSEPEGDIMQNDDDHNQEDLLTEVVYLDDSYNSKTKPCHEIVPTRIETLIGNKRRKTTSQRRTRVRSPSPGVVPRKTMRNEKSEEIEKFGVYITCLLKQIPQDLCTKLQMDIVNLVMNAKLNHNSAKRSAVDNKIAVIDGVPVTIQTVGAVPETGIVLTVPNTVEDSKKNLKSNLESNESDDKDKNDTEAETNIEIVTTNTNSDENASSAEVTSAGDNFTSYGYSFTVAPSNKDDSTEPAVIKKLENSNE